MIIQRIFRKLWWANLHRTMEVAVVAYPKAGSTWLRYLLGRYLQTRCRREEVYLFDGADRFGRCDRACEGPSMHFTHQPLVWAGQTAADLHHRNVIRPFARKRVILLARYPLDALISHWFQVRASAKHDGRELDLDLVGFITDPVWGLEKLIAFYNLWIRHSRDAREILLVRYEDLRSNTHAELERVLTFLRVGLDDRAMQRAISDASFESMQRLEASGGGPRYRLSGISIFAGYEDPADLSSLHVRRGKVGGFRDYLSGPDCARFERRIAAELDPRLGYSASGVAVNG